MRRHAGESTVPRSAHEAAKLVAGDVIVHAAASAALQRASVATGGAQFVVRFTVLVA